MLVADWRARGCATVSGRGRRPVAPRLGRPLRHDARRAPDHRPGRGRRLRCLRFSGHGFMQAPAVGAAVAEELLGERPRFDLAPYRLERFAGGASFPETLVL